tara:strand:- start:1883 stop:2161 length:279 start_codon:yes stop_codon:yes gene_type:complete
MSNYLHLLRNMQLFKSIIIEQIDRNENISSKDLRASICLETGIEITQGEIIQILTLFPKDFELLGFIHGEGSIWGFTKTIKRKVGLVNEVKN